MNYVENAHDRFPDPSDLTRGCDPQVPPFTLSCGVWLGIFYHSCGVCLNGWESAPSADGWPWHVRRKTLSSTNFKRKPALNVLRTPDMSIIPEP